MLSKLPNPEDGGGRIGIILNGSTLFTGGAGSGESEIRRHLLENDLLEGIVALPTDIFYNTSIATYVWILSNKKAANRKGRVQLINGVDLYAKMRKSLGAKRHEMGDDHIKTITRTFGDFIAIDPQTLDGTTEADSARSRKSAKSKSEPEKTFSAKVFLNHAFGYRRITVERPLRESYQFSDARLASLRFAPGVFSAPMEWIYQSYGAAWSDEPSTKGKNTYGVLDEYEAEIHAALKADFPELKEKQIKDLLDADTWRAQLAIFKTARQLQTKIGTAQHDDMNGYDDALRATGIKLETAEKKQITAAVSWTNPAAAKVIKTIHKTGKPDPIYGRFEGNASDGRDGPQGRPCVVEYEADCDLRDIENVALDPSQTVNALNEAYFKKEVLPHAPDAWIDATKRDPKDNQVGIVGYEIPIQSLLLKSRTNDVTGAQRKLKTLIYPDPNGPFLWNRNAFVPKTGQSKSNDTSVRVDETVLNAQYFNLFIQSEAGSNWISQTFNPSNNSSITLSRLLQSTLQIPALSEQTLAVQSYDTYLSILSRLHDIGASIVTNPAKSDLELQKYSNTNNRFEDEFTHMLPHPLAILWIQAQNALDEKSKCEQLVWFYEYLGLYIISILLGQLTDLEKEEVFRAVARNAEKPSLTMGTSYNAIRYIRAEYQDRIHPQLRELTTSIWEEILKDATAIRNEIHHQGLNSKRVLDACVKKLELLNEKIAYHCRHFFESTDLITPISSSYKVTAEGEVYSYCADLLDGLALNPCVVKKAQTRTPMESETPYLIIDETPPKITTHHKLSSLIKLLNVDDESGMRAFYFYNKWDSEQRKYVYICPYQCAAPHKFLEEF